MLYVNDDDLTAIETDWPALIHVIKAVAHCMDSGDFAQPIKPYLRYREPKNRIIAMPAYVGGAFETAGIKWIASFPDNRKHGLPRAHSVVILNDAHTGVPEAIINSPALSVLRTAAVSGLVLREASAVRDRERQLTAAVIGFGPIGQAHLRMLVSCLGDKLKRIYIHDVKGLTEQAIEPMIEPSFRERVQLADTWEDAYRDADIVITCTVAESRYITREPKPGALLLNVSLRDYSPAALKSVRAILVDDWDEVCRENTDIELLHKESGLRKEATRSIVDAVCRNAFREWSPDETVLFCPMGLSVFDIGIASYYVGLAKERGVGLSLK